MIGDRWTTIRDRVRRRLEDPNARKVTDALLLDLANEEQAELYLDLVEFDSSRFLEAKEVAAAVDREVYDLPQGCMALAWAERADLGEANRFKIPIVRPSDLEEFRFAGKWAGFYRDYPQAAGTASETITLLRENQFRVAPTPRAVGAIYRLWYVPAPADMVGTNDVTVIPKEFLTLYVLGICIRVSSVKNADARSFEREREGAWRRFRRAAGRVRQTPIVVPEVELPEW